MTNPIKPSFYEILIKYYIFINHNPETCIPFHLYCMYLSSLPVQPDRNGPIYKCESCQFYMISKPSQTQKRGYPLKDLLLAFLNETYLANYISYYINNYRGIYHQTSRNRPSSGSQQMHQLFKDLHEKEAGFICNKFQSIQYLPLVLDYALIEKQYHQLVQELQISQIHDRYQQLYNYLNLILQQVNLKGYNYTPRDAFIIMQLTRKYCLRYNKSNLDTIFACFSFLYLNKLLNPKKLELIQQVKDGSYQKYEILKIKYIPTIFNLSYSTFVQNYKQIIQDLLQNPLFINRKKKQVFSL